MNNFLRSIVLLTGIIMPAFSYGVDFCDHSHVSSLIDSLISKNSFKSCKMQSLKQNSYNTSNKLISLLASLKQNYLDSITSVSDDESNGGTDQTINMSSIDLVSTTQEIEDFSKLDSRTMDGLKKLKEQAVGIFSSLDTLKTNIIALKPSFDSGTQSQDECEADFRAEKLLKLRNQIIKCVDKLKEQIESTTDETGDSE